jgi:hypothetical protein
MRALNVLLACLVSVAIGLLALELGLRLIPGLAPQPTLNRPDPVTGWSKVPGKSVVRRVAGERIRFQINEHGLRDDPGVGPGKEPGTYRVLMLGDSFVLGYTVERSELFVDLLEGWWGSEERRTDVVNAGTEGWSTDQEVAWFLANGKAYQPDLVLLFPYENDIYWNGQRAYENGIPKPVFRPDGQFEPWQPAEPRERPWLASSATLQFLQRTAGWLRGQLEGPPPLRAEFGVLLTQPPAEYEEWCRRTEGALRALRDGCSFIGARLLLCPIPSKSAVDPEEREFFRTWQRGLAGLGEDQWSPDRPVNLFLELARRLGIEALDPRSALADATRSRGKLYFEEGVEWHFNGLGNRVFASWLHAELDRREVFPPEHRPRRPGALPEPEVASGGVPAFVYVLLGLWALLGTSFCLSYPKEPRGRSFLLVGALLVLVFAIVLLGGALLRLIPHSYAPWIVASFVSVILGFVAWKLGRRLATILELLRAFTLRGHWYLMPLVVVLLTIGSLLVVAASSPLIAPFIYTLF